MRLYGYILLLFPITLLAQSPAAPPTMEDILVSAWQDSLYRQIESDERFLADGNWKLPRLEELEFRTETHNFDPERQEYAVRLQLNSSKQIKTQVAIRNHAMEVQALEQEAHLEELLFQRYQLLVAIHSSDQWTQLYQAQQDLLDDQKRIITRQLENGRSQVFGDLLQWEEDQLNHSEKEQALAQRRQTLQRQMQIWLPGNSTITAWSNFPSLENLQALVSNWTLPANSIEQRLQALQSEEVALELAEEQAEQKNLLNFLQLRYTGDNDPIFRDRLTVGAGINLPFRNANSVKMQYLELERREEEREAQQEEWELAGDWLLLKAQWQDRFATYQQARDELVRYENEYAPIRLQTIGIRDAEVLLQAQEGVLKRQQRVLENQEEAYQQFIDLLLLSGRMTQQPYQNWLTSLPLVVE